MSRRMKVQLDPNELFAGTEAVRRAQIVVKRVPEQRNDGRGSGTPTIVEADEVKARALLEESG